MVPAAVDVQRPQGPPAPAIPDLGPQNLIKQHFEDAERESIRIKELRAQLQDQAHLKTTGPQGHVEPFAIIKDPSAWYTADVKASKDWVYQLTAEDVKEIDSALEHAASLGIRHEGNLLHVQEKLGRKELFPLPNLGPKLEKLRDEVVWGRGFQLLRGLPVEKYTREQVVLIYWAFGLYWGIVVSQNAKGHIVGHVKNIGHDVNNPITRVYTSPLAQPHHNDSADVVALLCLKQAKEGGLSSWASSITIHNELIKLGRLDLVEEFAKPIWWIDRKGELRDDQLEAFQLRVFSYFKGYLSVFHSGTYYELSQRHRFVPRLTEKQKEALRLFTALAEDPALKMEFLLQPGDIQLLNNHTQQHKRSSFVDYDDIDERRHLLRLWVSPRQNRPIPEEYVELWNSTVPGERGGIYVKGALTVPLEAE